MTSNKNPELNLHMISADSPCQGTFGFDMTIISESDYNNVNLILTERVINSEVW